jgi:hypothetical protein
MADHKIDWVVDDRVLMLSTDGSLDAGDQESLTSATAEFLRGGEGPVHVIEDQRGLQGIEGISLEAIKQAVGLVGHDKLGQVVVLVPSRFEGVTDALASITDSVSDADVTRLSSLPEAVDHLRQADPTLPELSEWTLPS